MSIRIHELAKRIGMDGKEMLALLKERGYVAADTKSVSSTVCKIYVEEIEKEFAPGRGRAGPGSRAAAASAPAAGSPTPEGDVGEGKLRLPAGIFVKTAGDIARERDAKAAAAAALAAPRNPLPAPASACGRRHRLRLPRPARSRPRRLRPPVPSPRASPRARPRRRGLRRRPRRSPLPALRRSPRSPGRRRFLRSPGRPVLRRPLRSPAQPRPRRAPRSSRSRGSVKIIHLKPPIIVRDFATALGLKPFKLISELNQLVGFASMNSNIEETVAQKVAEKYGFLLEIRHRGDSAGQQQSQKVKEKPKTEEDEAAQMAPRPPVVCILGHVDHGKTSLLDAIRKANVAAGEAGGITQHIGAYQIEFNSRKITFLDTPGHAAFNKMRARGAAVTDIAVLVVAADDGFMPQTDEALQHAKNAKVALVVAVNKMDVKGANLDQVKAQMQQRGIAPEDWGGETITVPVSAIKGTGINDLLEMILLQADVLELKANPKAEAGRNHHRVPGRRRPGTGRDRHRPARHAPGRRRARLRRPLGQGPRDVRRPGPPAQGGAARDPRPDHRLVGHPRQRRGVRGRQERPGGREPRRGGGAAPEEGRFDRDSPEGGLRRAAFRQHRRHPAAVAQGHHQDRRLRLRRGRPPACSRASRAPRCRSRSSPPTSGSSPRTTS